MDTPTLGAPGTALFWMGPELARGGHFKGQFALFPDIEARVARAVGLYVNQALHPAATLLAALHPRAVEYLEQAPILAMAATFGGKIEKKQERAYVAMNFAPLMDRGVKLRDLMATYRVAYQLRAVSGNAIRPGAWPVLKRISELVDPSSIAQAIPADPKKHMFWLNDLTDLWNILERRLQFRAELHGPILRWAMFAIARAEKGKRFPKDDVYRDLPARGPHTATAGEIADFLIAEHTRFNPRWTWERMIQETRDWHEAIANANLDTVDDGRMDVEIDYGRTFPAEIEVDGFQFHALRSLRALIIEGRTMHHCVSSYYPDVVAGRCRIYSVRKDGKRIATVEFLAFPAARAVQVKGPCNISPGEAVHKAADRLAKGLNRQLPSFEGPPIYVLKDDDAHTAPITDFREDRQ